MIGNILDVSHHNGDIDWSEVAKEDVPLVFIKATEGARFTDPKFEANRKAAEDNDLMVVPYHFINAEPATQQLEHFQEVTGFSLMEPVMLDWERGAGGTRPPEEIFKEMAEGALQSTSRFPLLYYGEEDFIPKWTVRYPWFLPRYRRATPEHQSWLFWQNTRTHTVPGISGHVDHSFFNGTKIELQIWFERGLKPEPLA